MSFARHSDVRLVLIFVCLALGSHAASGQRAAQNAPGRAKSLSCVFPVLVTGTWKAGEPVAEVKTAKLLLQFDMIEAQEGSARYTGGDSNLGPAEITAQLSGGSLHLMQTGRSGAVYITTVLPSESRGGKLKAVHARHEYTEVSLPGYTSRPEQYYGECEAKE